MSSRRPEEAQNELQEAQNEPQEAKEMLGSPPGAILEPFMFDVGSILKRCLKRF